MASTSLIALAAMLLTGSVRAHDGQPHVVAVAVARATIVSGVRAGPPPERRDRVERVEAKSRERPCPESTKAPCRLIVTDLE